MSLMSARTRWTCTVGTEDACCKNIPVTILEDSEGKQCAASFPYSELVIKRNGGSFKPKVSWKLQQTVPTPPAYVFGSAGIEVTPIGSTPLPVETTGPDRCHYNGTQDRFVCKGTGRRLAKADHVANVYKTGFMDDPLYRCGNVDPTIISTD